MIDKLLELRQKFREEYNDFKQLLVKLIMESLYGEQICKDIEESYEYKSEAWIMVEYDERVLDYQKINHGNYVVKLKDGSGLEDEVKKVNTMPLHLGAFILSNSKPIMNILYTQSIDFTQTMFIVPILIAYIMKINTGKT